MPFLRFDIDESLNVTQNTDDQPMMKSGQSGAQTYKTESGQSQEADTDLREVESQSDESETVSDEKKSVDKSPIDELEDADMRKLSEIKVWLFRENIRIQSEKQNLQMKSEAFDREKRLVKEQMRDEGRRIEDRKRQFEQEKKLFEEKWKLLKRGFDELDQDRRALKRMEQRIEEQRRQIESSSNSQLHSDSNASMFFKGVSDMYTLKKRYKDLLKIYHPDNAAGDKDIVVIITKEYNSLKGIMGN